MDNFKQRFQFYWNIRWLRRSVISAVTLTIILLLIPVAIQYSITYLLVKQGASKADIQDINLNLFAGTFELKQLVVFTGEHSPSELKHLSLNINMLDLVSSKIVLHELGIDGLKADIYRSDDGVISINGLVIPINDSPSNKTKVSQEEPSDLVAFGIENLSIVNSAINYQETGFSQLNQLNSLSLSNLKSWETTSYASLKLDSILNNAAFTINAELNLFNAIQHVKGQVSLNALEFTHYAKFYAEHLDNLQGKISLESDFDIHMSESISANLINSFQINELDASYQGMKPAVKKFTLQGKTTVSNINITEFIDNAGKLAVIDDDTKLNLFTGSLEIDQLAISTDNNESSQVKQIVIDISNLDLLSNRFEVNEVLIDGVKTNIHRDDDGQIAINGLIIPKSETTTEGSVTKEEKNSNPITFGLNKLTLLNSDINYSETDFKQKNHINSVVVSNLKSWDKSSNSNLELDSILNDATFKLVAELNLFNDVKQFKGNASLNSLAFTHYVKFYRDHLDNFQGNISLNSEFDVSMSESVSAKLTNDIQIADLSISYRDISQTVENIAWKGVTELSEKAELSVKGDLQIKNSLSQDIKQKYKVSSFDELSITGLQKNLQGIGFEQFNLVNIELVNSQPDNTFVKLDNIQIQQALFQPEESQLKIETIELENPAIQLSITQQKQLAQLLPLLSTIENLKPAAEEKPQTEKNRETTEPMDIRIGKLKLLKPGLIDFTDLSVSPEYKTQISLHRLNIENISSLENAVFDIALKQGKYTTYDIKGDGLVFDPTKHLQLTAEIKQLDLPPVTPYSSNAMGYGMKSGVIDSDITLKLDNRIIDSEVALKIDSIEVVETDQNTAEQVSSASGMSIDLAISSLKDSDNVIDLKLPIKGSIDEPDFDLNLIINKAMGKAMKSATLSYLKHTLQPFGSLITLYSLAKKAADHISLPPVLFQPNSLALKDDQQQLMEKVIKLLSERPALKIKACGVSALEDHTTIKDNLLKEEVARLEAINKAANEKKAKTSESKTVEPVAVAQIVIDPELIQQKMRDLADNRSAKIKAVFVEQGKLEPNRILNCLSSTSTEEKSVASVELLI